MGNAGERAFPVDTTWAKCLNKNVPGVLRSKKRPGWLGGKEEEGQGQEVGSERTGKRLQVLQATVRLALSV